MNDREYLFLRDENPIDCLDRKRSDLDVYQSDPSKILNVRHFVFTSDVPSDPVLFCLPGSFRLFATESLAKRIARSDLRGIVVEPLP